MRFPSALNHQSHIKIIGYKNVKKAEMFFSFSYPDSLGFSSNSFRAHPVIDAPEMFETILQRINSVSMEQNGRSVFRTVHLYSEKEYSLE